MSEHAYPFVHAGPVLDVVCKCISLLRDDIDGCNSLVLSKVPSLRHRIVRVDVKLATARCSSFGKHVQVV